MQRVIVCHFSVRTHTLLVITLKILSIVYRARCFKRDSNGPNGFECDSIGLIGIPFPMFVHSRLARTRAYRIMRATRLLNRMLRFSEAPFDER